MTTMIEEKTTSISGIDLDGTPPCQCLQDSSQCGNPSSFRILSICLCGNIARIFICKRCNDIILSNEATCSYCCRVRTITEYL